jgi:hypothetical protein
VVRPINEARVQGLALGACRGAGLDRAGGQGLYGARIGSLRLFVYLVGREGGAGDSVLSAEVQFKFVSRDVDVPSSEKPNAGTVLEASMHRAVCTTNVRHQGGGLVSRFGTPGSRQTVHEMGNNSLPGILIPKTFTLIYYRSLPVAVQVPCTYVPCSLPGVVLPYLSCQDKARRGSIPCPVFPQTRWPCWLRVIDVNGIVVRTQFPTLPTRVSARLVWAFCDRCGTTRQRPCRVVSH